MSKILIAGAGGTPSENVIKSLLKDKKKEKIIGMGSESYDLILSKAEKKYLVPYAVEKDYKKSLLSILNKEQPDLVHFQNDIEIREASLLRKDIINAGTKVYMPDHDVIENCVDKGKSYQIWKKAGLKVPETMVINTQKDLKTAFNKLGNKEGKIWLRSTVGGGGKGALPTNDYEFAKLWIDRYNGWGSFTAAELLSSKTVTWLSIWYQGELVVAQTRKRHSWKYANRTESGVTGITRVGITCSDNTVTKVAEDSISSIDSKPHGVYAVDMTYDMDGFPNPTEINISRFFTTVDFFTEAGLNMPKIFKNIALYNEFPAFEEKINPLPNGLLWIRSMDREPLLTTQSKVDNTILIP